MVFFQKIQNGELSERRLRYSPSLVRSMKESVAGNRSGYGKGRYAEYSFEFENDSDDGLGIALDDKKFKMVSDKTANTISQLRGKASALMGGKQFS